MRPARLPTKERKLDIVVTINIGVKMRNRRQTAVISISTAAIFLVGGCSSERINNAQPAPTPTIELPTVEPATTECRTEAEFLNSPDGVAFQAAAFRATKAYLSGETAEQREDLFSRIDYLILKWSLDDKISENTARASYEFRLLGEDSVSYVSMELTKVDGQWQVTSIGMEK